MSDLSPRDSAIVSLKAELLDTRTTTEHRSDICKTLFNKYGVSLVDLKTVVCKNGELIELKDGKLVSSQGEVIREQKKDGRTKNARYDWDSAFPKLLELSKTKTMTEASKIVGIPVANIAERFSRLRKSWMSPRERASNQNKEVNIEQKPENRKPLLSAFPKSSKSVNSGSVYLPGNIVVEVDSGPNGKKVIITIPVNKGGV